MRCPYCRARLEYEWATSNTAVKMTCPVCGFEKEVEAVLMRCEDCGRMTPHAVGRIRGERRYFVCVCCGSIVRADE